MKQKLTGKPGSRKFCLLIALTLFVFTPMISAPSDAFVEVGLEADGTSPNIANTSSNTDISLTENGGIGVYTHDGGTASLSADVIMGGGKSDGARAEYNGSVHIRGDVKAEGDGSTGIAARYGSSADIYGSIAVSGDSSTGALALDNSKVHINGDIKAEGVPARGIVTAENGSAEIYGNISVRGSSPIGALTMDTCRVHISGDIKSEGDNAWGISVSYKSSAYISGDVYVSGDNSHGLASYQVSEIFIGSSSVKAYGSGNTALRVGEKGSIHLDNTAVSSDAALLLTDSGGNLNAANRSSLYGTIGNVNDSYAGKELNMNLSGGSIATGSIHDTGALAVTNVTLGGPGDAWLVTHDSQIKGSLTNNGKLDYSSSAMGTEVTVGRLNGNGIFTMKADIAGKACDKLIVTGASSGSYMIEVSNISGRAATGKERLTLVETADRKAVFALKKDVELGGHVYSLRQSRTEAGAIWELHRVGAPAL